MIGAVHAGPPRRRGALSKAMTLVEVLVATVILGMGVAGLMSAAGLSLRNQQRSEWRAAALCVAQQKLSEVDLIGPHVWMLARPTSGEERQAEHTYRWSLSIEQEPVGELFIVRVTVDWPDPGRGSVELETWLNDYKAKAADSSAGNEQPNPNAADESSRRQPRGG